MPVARSEFIRTFWRSAALVLGGLFMTWPALYNRYPVLYPDSISYLAGGRLVARAIFLHRFSTNYGGRSLIYGLGILPMHWNISPWPVVALHALLTAYLIWLVVRSIMPRRTVMGYFALLIPLSLFTSLAWFVSLIMPDILGPVLYLSIYLLVFAGETISPRERLAVFLIAWWAVASHITHLILGSGLCIVLATVLVLQRQPVGRWMGVVSKLAAIILLASAAHLALHTYLYGRPSLTGRRPAFLMARVIADGPGRWYLQQRCGQAKFVICDHVQEVRNDMSADDFLWERNGIWQTASPMGQERLRAEETAFVLAVLRTYPRAELAIAIKNFWEQLRTFALWGYGPDPWISEAFDRALPGARWRYLQTEQAQGALPAEFSTTAQNWMVITALGLVGALTALRWRHLSPRLVGLTVIIVSITIANAFVTGVFSVVEDRFQARVIWLLPLLAGLFVLEWLDYRHIDHFRESRLLQLKRFISASNTKGLLA
jgi:hypothetical protein